MVNIRVRPAGEPCERRKPSSISSIFIRKKKKKKQAERRSTGGGQKKKGMGKKSVQAPYTLHTSQKGGETASRGRPGKKKGTTSLFL